MTKRDYAGDLSSTGARKMLEQDPRHRPGQRAHAAGKATQLVQLGS